MVVGARWAVLVFQKLLMFSLQGIVRKKESSELQFFGLKLCSGENDQTASSRLEGELR